METNKTNNIEELIRVLSTIGQEEVQDTPTTEVPVPKIESIVTGFLDTIEKGELPTLEEAETINILNRVLRGR